MTRKITVKSTLETLSKLPPREKMSKKDRKFYSEIGSALMKNELELLINNKQWVLAVISLASMLDFTGKTKLIWNHKGSVSERKINNYKFFKTIKELLNSNIIGDQTYRKMEEIRKTRNNFAHNLLRLFSLSNEPNPSLEKLIRDGVKIIETLLKL